MRSLGIFNILSSSGPAIEIARHLCRDRAFVKSICENTLLLLGGFGTTQLNTSIIPTILGHTPAGASTKTFLHYAQMVKSGRFCQFDYGPERNSRLYGDVKPPDYKLDNVKTPVSLHFGGHDSLTSRTDLSLLYEKLGNCIGNFRVPLKQFNHLDFLWGKDAKTLVYDRIIELINKN